MSLCVVCREHEAPGLQCDVCRARATISQQGEGGRIALPGPPEDAIRRAVKEWYRLQGAEVWDTEQGYRPSKCRHCGQDTGQGGSRVDKGMPDLVVLWPGRGVRFVELKSAKGRQTPEQRQFQRACERAGEPYLLVRSLEEAMAWEAAH